MTSSVLDAIVHYLGYIDQPGYVDLASGSLDHIGSKRFTLCQAKNHMSVVGTFGIWGAGHQHCELTQSSFTPLVYIAEADTLFEAEQIHRKVWSQGCVPFLLIVVSDSIIHCNGFSYNSTQWADCVEQVEIADVEKRNLLSHLKSRYLRSSLVWRDYAIDTRNRIDTKLLSSLEELNKIYSVGNGSCPCLSPSIANRLIGKFVYLCMLYDRKILSSEWIQEYAPSIDLEDQNTTWITRDVWALFDKIDELFNGSVFPIRSAERRQIKVGHIAFLRQVIRHGADVSSSGIQLSFIDIHFASLQTETVSAVYEKFLETEDCHKKRIDGAFYTPPFLVDYIVDKADQLVEIRPGRSIFDPSCGSGAFLVSALRRIIEKKLNSKKTSTLSPSVLKKLVTDSIFATEKNLSACQVAAFSCYITILDYLSERDIKQVISGDEESPLFPPLVGTNIIHTDFFDLSKQRALPSKFDLVLGNPPWQKVDDISPQSGVELLSNINEYQVDQKEAAELFAWKAGERLQSSGVMALLMPTKSFVSPSAKTFACSFAKKFHIQGLSNFSHLRYRLFSSARQPATAIFCLANSEDSFDNETWVFSPYLNDLPISQNGKPWVIIENQAEVRKYPSHIVFESPDSIFDKTVLRPIDQRVLSFCNDKMKTGVLSSFNDLFKQANLNISRGGSPNQTNLNSNKLLGGDKNKENYFKYKLHINKDIDNWIEPEKTYELTSAELDEVPNNFKARFSGNIVVVPRSMNEAYFIREPIGFNSSLNAIYSESKRNSRQQIRLLKAIEKYLNSNFVRYLFALYGRLWIIDRTRLEVGDFRKIPIPISSALDERIDVILKSQDNKLDRVLAKLFNFDDITVRSVEEYLQFRCGFEDAQLPEKAFSGPQDNDIDAYITALENRLRTFVCDGSGFKVSPVKYDNNSLSIVSIRYQDNVHEASDSIAIDEVLNEYEKTGFGVLNSNPFIHYDEQSFTAHLIKPFEKSAWTLEKAYDDSQKIISRYME